MHVAACLGLPPGPGGRHAAMGTHNRLLALDGGAYLEAIAVDPEAPAPGRPRWFDLDRFEGQPRLSNWVVRVDDLDAALDAFPEAGEPLALERGGLRWRMAVPADGVLPFDGCFPALIQWETDPPALPASGLTLDRLELHHPQADALRARLADLIDDPRIAVARGGPALVAGIGAPDGPRVLR